MDFSLYYRKPKNSDLFHSLEESQLGLNNLQNYVPLYEKFFSLNTSNFNSINLNQKYYLNKINHTLTKNTLNVNVTDNSNNSIQREIFCKFSPLLDPLKFLTGKYDLSANIPIELPTYNSNNKFPKLLDKNNSAYVDAFFTYLSSQLLHQNNFINSIDYYGAFIGNQEKFLYNIVDDLEYLNDNDYFHNNRNVFFNLETDDYSDYFNIHSRTNKKKIVINDKIDKIKLDSFNNDDFKIFTHNNDNNDNNDEKNKVAVCHIPPGNPDNSHTIRIGESAVVAHIAHGDTLGDCDEENENKKDNSGKGNSGIDNSGKGNSNDKKDDNKNKSNSKLKNNNEDEAKDEDEHEDEDEDEDNEDEDD